MEKGFLLIKIAEIVLFVYLGFAATYYLIFALASKVGRFSKRAPAENTQRKFAVLIPGYKEDNVICEAAGEALKQNYPSDLFDVVVIADSFKPQTLKSLRELPIKVIEVSFEVSTKSKALNKAMEQIGDDYDVALILDADNIMERDFIEKVNHSFNCGYIIVQGHRVAKNTNTPFAILDAISEEINNSIFRKGHRVLGLSSALIGSGMAFDYKFFKQRMLGIKAVGGFDKELELTLLREGYVIEYLDHAIVFDEKVQKAEVFANQRKRWLSAQFVYFKRFCLSGIYHFFSNGNIDFLDKVYQMIAPPRVLLLGSTGMVMLLYTLFDSILGYGGSMVFSDKCWMIIFLTVVAALFISTPSKFWNKETLNSLRALPKAISIMYASLFKLKGANKKFIHTQHGAPKDNI